MEQRSIASRVTSWHVFEVYLEQVYGDADECPVCGHGHVKMILQRCVDGLGMQRDERIVTEWDDSLL